MMATFGGRIGWAAALVWLAAGWGALAQDPETDLPPAIGSGPAPGPAATQDPREANAPAIDDRPAAAPNPRPDLPPSIVEGPAAGPLRSFATSDDPATRARGACCPDHGRCRRGWFGRHRACCKRHLADSLLGEADQFESAPLGTSLYAINRAQVGNGEAARMAFREYDFEPGSDRLNPRGLDQIHRVAGLAGTTFHPILIERTLREPDLDRRRKLAVLSAFARDSFPVPSERILIGPSPSAGLGGIEAEILDRSLLYRTSTGGPPVVNPDSGDVLPLAAPPSGSGTGGP